MEAIERQTVLRFFKAFADESRLKIIGLLATRERGVDELAALLGLRAPTVSHHLGRLKEIDLVRMRPEGTTHLYRLDVEALRRLSKMVLTAETINALGEEVTGDAWERGVLAHFLDGERLKEIPASLKKRLVVLRWLAARFEPGTRYPEATINAVIKRHHPDTAALRRALIDHRLMRRENGVYWRLPDPAAPGAPG
jgi:hypothetical protein